MKKGSPRAIYLKDYTPPPFLIDEVRLYFDLRESHAEVLAQLSIRRNPEAVSRQAALVLNGEQLEAVSVSLDGVSLSGGQYLLDSEGLTVPDVPDSFRLETVCRIDPEGNSALEGLYKSGGNFCTQCEAEGFRKITWYLDRPDVMARFTTTIEADRERYPVLLSNGNLIEEGTVGGGRHFATWQDPFPKPSYLFALVAGDLVCRNAVFRTRSGRDVVLRVYVQAHNADRCAHALASLERAMRWDEERFGLEYDLDIYMIVAVDDFNMGAMENKGLNIFNSKYVLARPDTATDDDYMHIEGVIAHEYFHNWTGNRVTCRDWFQLSLKEGLTVFRDQEFTADMTSRPVKRIQDVRMLRAHQFVEDSGPMAHPVRPRSYIEINNFYTVTVYEKGAEVVRMFQTLLGREGFRKGMDLYFRRHDGRAVTTDDFCAAMADANGVDLGQFRRWYDQAGTPVLKVTDQWDGESGTYTLHVRQECPPTPGQPVKEPFLIPLSLGLLGPEGQDLPLQLEHADEPRSLQHTLRVEAREQSFVFTGLPARPVPSLLRNFSAPVRVEYDYKDQTLAFLLAHDSDPFNRWEAGQKLAVNQLLRLVDMSRAGQSLSVEGAVVDAFSRVLADAAQDPALTAEAMTLPGETYLSELVDEIDVDAVHAAREALLRALARSLEPVLRASYEKFAVQGEYSYDPALAGRRRLRNLCLAYLTRLGTGDYCALAWDQFRQADNMTDTMGALQALNQTACEEREAALKAFHDRWQDDALVMDKWFSMQAVSTLPGTLERVRVLMDHPLFNVRNPNRVRALIGSFVVGNPVAFHEPGGEGYRFLTDRILDLDPLNPQMAARLAKAFSRWRRFGPPRRALMQEQLRRVLATHGLSKDTFEVVSKSLD